VLLSIDFDCDLLEADGARIAIVRELEMGDRHDKVRRRVGDTASTKSIIEPGELTLREGGATAPVEIDSEVIAFCYFMVTAGADCSMCVGDSEEGQSEGEKGREEHFDAVKCGKVGDI